MDGFLSLLYKVCVSRGDKTRWSDVTPVIRGRNGVSVAACRWDGGTSTLSAMHLSSCLHADLANDVYDKICLTSPVLLHLVPVLLIRLANGDEMFILCWVVMDR